MNLYESINASIKRNPYVESISRNYNLDYTNADVMSDYIDYIDDYIIGEGHNLTKDGISDVFVDLFDDGRVPPKGFDRAKVEEALCKHYSDYLNEHEGSKKQTYTIKQTAGSFGTYTLCDWESTSPEKAVEEFIEQNPEFKDRKKGHITATLKESDDKKCVLCGKHFKEWGNDPWPLADEGWCCDKCNMEKVVPARIAMAYKKEEPKTEEKKEAEYGNGTRHYSEALIDLCEQGIVNWRTVAEGLINYCSEDDVEDFCRMYDFKDLIDNPTGDDSLEEADEKKEYDYTKRKYGDNGYYTKSLTELCEHGDISWERLVRKLIDYFPGEAIKVFCIAHQYTQAIHNPTGDYYDKYYSEALIELCEDGEVEWRHLAKGLLDFFTEDELKDFYVEQHFPDATSEDSESPKEDLKESPETTNYPDWIIAELSEGNDVQAWYCPDCDTFFKEPKYVSTDMENYYGVGSDFSDHHYQDIPVCPNCDKDNLEEVYISFDSLVDDFLSNEDNYQKVYEEISNRHPEYIKSSDTLLEDIPEDVLIPVVKELMF